MTTTLHALRLSNARRFAEQILDDLTSARPPLDALPYLPELVSAAREVVDACNALRGQMEGWPGGGCLCRLEDAVAAAERAMGGEPGEREVSGG